MIKFIRQKDEHVSNLGRFVIGQMLFTFNFILSALTSTRNTSDDRPNVPDVALIFMGVR